MSWITIVWSMNAAACLTLATIYLLVWSKQRERWAYLVLSCNAVAGAALTAFELWLLRAQSAEEYAEILRWTQLPVWSLIVTLVVFVRLYLRAGRLWLAWSVCSARTLALILNFVFIPNLRPQAGSMVGWRDGVGSSGRNESVDFSCPTESGFARYLFRRCHYHCLAAG